MQSLPPFFGGKAEYRIWNTVLGGKISSPPLPQRTTGMVAYGSPSLCQRCILTLDSVLEPISFPADVGRLRSIKDFIRASWSE